MSYIPTQWKDHQVEAPRRHTITDNGDGSAMITPAPKEVYQQGTNFSAEHMNHIELGIAEAHELVGEAQEAADKAQETADAALPKSEFHPEDFATAAQGAKADAALPSASFTTENIIAKANLGSGLRADLLGGQPGTYYATQAALNTVNAKTGMDIKTTQEPVSGSITAAINELASLIGLLRIEFDELKNNIIPVGGIYHTMNPTDPSVYFGGTWVRIAQGRTLVGVNAADIDFMYAGRTGGQKTVTLSASQMPEHNHGLLYSKDNGATFTETALFGRGGGSYTHPDGAYFGVMENIQALSTWNGKIGYAGQGQPVNNVQEYLAVYIWQRVA